MTQFETNLSNMRENLDAEQQSYEQEKWSLIRATELEEFRRRQESLCNEGIAALQQQRDEAVKQKEDQLRADLKAEVDRKFGAARQKLEEVQTLFSGGNAGNN